MKKLPVLLMLLIAVAAMAQEKSVNTRSGEKNAAIDPALSGQGKKNFVPLWRTQTELGSSKISQKGGMVGIGTTTPGALLDVNGAMNATSINLGGKLFSFGSYSAQNAFSGFAGNTK